MQALHDAILEALLNGGLLSDETLEKMLGKDWKAATMPRRGSTS